MLVGLVCRRTSGKSSRTISRLPSSLALSTTTTSNASPGCGFCRKEVRHCSSSAQVFQLSMIMDKSKSSPLRFVRLLNVGHPIVDFDTGKHTTAVGYLQAEVFFCH